MTERTRVRCGGGIGRRKERTAERTRALRRRNRPTEREDGGACEGAAAAKPADGNKRVGVWIYERIFPHIAAEAMRR
ncbi:MAG: hypothetical protein NC432_10630 [Roseburia sp.]|nr:hypothetical protein [Roseburia sp.]MCM1099262.1 hypothetical protein [Ruminococcus flavefaciens]